MNFTIESEIASIDAICLVIVLNSQPNIGEKEEKIQ